MLFCSVLYFCIFHLAAASAFDDGVHMFLCGITSCTLLCEGIHETVRRNFRGVNIWIFCII